MYQLLAVIYGFLFASIIVFASDNDLDDRDELKGSNLYKYISQDNADIEEELIVTQNGGMCYACAPYPSLMYMANLPKALKLSLVTAVLLGTNKKPEAGGSSVVVLQNIKNADFQLAMNEDYELKEAIDFNSYISSLSTEHIISDKFEFDLSRLPKVLRNVSAAVKSVLQEKIKDKSPTSAYDTLLAFSGQPVKVAPYNIHVFYPDSDEEVYQKLFEILRNGIPVIFNYSHPDPKSDFGQTLHAIAIADIRIANHSDKNNKLYEIKIINNWGPGKYNGWFEASAFVRARASIDPLVYLERCDYGTNTESLPKCVAYVQGNFAAHRPIRSPLNHAAFHNNSAGIKALISENYPHRDEIAKNIYVPIRNNDVDLLTMMIDYSVDRNEAIRSALVDSVLSKNNFIFNVLLDRVSVEVLKSTFSVPKNRTSLLHDAVRLKQAEMVKKLLSRGADANLEDKSGYSALDYAQYLYPSDEMMRLLETSAEQ